MGAEEQAKGEQPQMNGEAGDVQAVPPPEEPPKMEEIVTPEVLQATLDGYKPGSKLLSFHAEPGSKIGDNYMSIMYRVDIELESKDGKETLPIMLKTLPRNVFRQEMINEMMAFKKEAAIYQQVFPRVIQEQEKREIPKEQRFSAWPICYAAHLDGTTDFLAMENLKLAGYKMGNRAVGLDFNHCTLVLQNMARYHATTFAMFGGDRDKILEAFPVLGKGMFNKEAKTSEMQAQFFKTSFVQQAEQLRSAGEVAAATRLDKIANTDLLSFLEELTTKGVENAVISHGDCWLNNMLFKYGENDEKSSHPVAVKFLDFQLSSATSRLVDVFYFLMTSCQMPVLKEREQDLLMTYYTEFTKNVQYLGIDTHQLGLTWENFMKEARKYMIYGVLLGLILAPMLAADSADIPDMDSFTKEDMENSDETMKKFYSDLIKDTALKKVKAIVLEHMPKCEGIDGILN